MINGFVLMALRNTHECMYLTWLKSQKSEDFSFDNHDTLSIVISMFIIKKD